MKRATSIALTLLLGLALLWGASGLHGPLLEARRVYDLDHGEPLENAPPLIVFSTVALGGFSGVLADILWMRAAQLQQEGQYFELVQLADWITKLQPRFPEGWVYHAWNLTYNISAMFDRPADRWRWVRQGLEMLRDGGIRYNPRHARLYWELGWFFQHKLGSDTDRAHRYYQYEWAMEMQRLFDGPRPDYAAMERVPAQRGALLQTPGMPALIDALRTAGFDPFAYRWPEGDRYAEWLRIVAAHPAGAVLLDHWRLRIMEDGYKLIPDRMRRIEEELGSLDWRMPQAHAIYWAWSGKPHARDQAVQQFDRMIFQNMAAAFREGRFLHDPETDRFLPSPNPDLLPYVLHAFEQAIATHDQPTMHVAYHNFMRQALAILYTTHRMDTARTLFERLRQLQPEEVGLRDLDSYTIDVFVQDLTVLAPFEALAFVEGMLYQSYFWMALDDTARATGYDRLATQAWHRYQASARAGRAPLSPLEELRRTARDRVRETLDGPQALQRLPADG